MHAESRLSSRSLAGARWPSWRAAAAWRRLAACRCVLPGCASGGAGFTSRRLPRPPPTVAPSTTAASAAPELDGKPRARVPAASAAAARADRPRRRPSPRRPHAEHEPPAVGMAPAAIPGLAAGLPTRRPRSSASSPARQQLQLRDPGRPPGPLHGGRPHQERDVRDQEGAEGGGASLTITGGPGTSGLDQRRGLHLDSSSSRRSPTTTTSWSPSTSAASASSQPLGCPGCDRRPTTRRTRIRPIPRSSTGSPTTARTYVRRLPRRDEGPTRRTLPYYSTRQAVEDLRGVSRVHGRGRQVNLYGESYGTQYVQTYAAAHPDHVASLFLDGPVDLTRRRVGLLPGGGTGRSRTR